MADKLLSSNLNGCIYEHQTVPCSFTTSRQYATATFSGNVHLATIQTALADNVYSAYLPNVTIINISNNTVSFLYQSAVAGSFNVHLDAIITKP